MNQLKEWRKNWNDGDIKFVPELFELVERYEKALDDIKNMTFGNVHNAPIVADKVLRLFLYKE